MENEIPFHSPFSVLIALAVVFRNAGFHPHGGSPFVPFACLNLVGKV
jgi:hypothetical protein